MTNEQARERDVTQKILREHGDRLASLEERFNHMSAELSHQTKQLNHLDDCVDSVRTEAVENASAVNEKLRVWEKRFDLWSGRLKSALWVLLGAVLAAGSGTVSLKSLIDLIGKIH